MIREFSKGDSLDIGESKTFSRMFREACHNYPDGIAIDDGVDQISYGDLERSTNSIASDLQNNYDIDLNRPVTLMLPQDYHFPEMALALNKLGVAFIPVDPSYLLKRIDYMLNITQSNYIITTREFSDLPEFTADVIYIEDLRTDLVSDFEINDQNMFILPPIGGTSFVLYNLAKNIDFEGNVYLIDDFKYGLTLDEIMGIEDNHHLTLKGYSDAIRNLFNDGDVIVGYSLGCVYAALICEELEKTREVSKFIRIDGTLKFIIDEGLSRKDVLNNLANYVESQYMEFLDLYSDDFKDKLVEIFAMNSNYSFHTPKVDSHIVYLSTSDEFNEDLDKISDNYEFIYIDSTHKDIVEEDIDKIADYFN